MVDESPPESPLRRLLILAALLLLGGIGLRLVEAEEAAPPVASSSERPAVEALDPEVSRPASDPAPTATDTSGEQLEIALRNGYLKDYDALIAAGPAGR